MQVVIIARKGLPKKYAKMGFKKGWREYKKAKRSRSKPKRTYSSRKRSRSTKRTYRRKNSMKLGNKALVGGLIAGALAGAVQGYLGVPYGDDIAILGYGLFTNNKTLQTIGAIGLGNDLVSGFTGGMNGGSNGVLGG